MNKKGEWGWEEISKIILMVIVVILLIAIIFYLKSRGFDLSEKIINLLRFG